MTFEQLYNDAANHMALGQFAEAIPVYEQAKKLQPAFARLYNDLGIALYNVGRLEEALLSYQTAIYITPFDYMPYMNLGVLMTQQERHGEALAYYHFANTLQPNQAMVLANIGDAYTKLSSFQNAEACLLRALELEPKRGQALINMGTALWGLGRIDEAEQMYVRAVDDVTTEAMAHKNIGILALLRGNYRLGWAKYAWRFKADNVIDPCNNMPRWLGEEAPVTVFREQGIGDQILHASMFDDLSARGQPVTWETDIRLVPLFRRSFPTATIVSASYQAIGTAATRYIPAASLGGILRNDVADFKGTPYLIADGLRASALKQKLGERFTVGVSWASVGTQFAASKFVPLPAWDIIFKTASGQFVDLQYNSGENDRAGSPLIDVPEIDKFNDLDGLAALITACDLVITISNVTAHLAAALGKETWVIVPAGYGKFWYWGVEGGTTPWYKSVRLFRQEKPDDWSDVMLEIAQALLERRLGPSPAP